MLDGMRNTSDKFYELVNGRTIDAAVLLGSTNSWMKTIYEYKEKLRTIERTGENIESDKHTLGTYRLGYKTQTVMAKGSAEPKIVPQDKES